MGKRNRRERTGRLSPTKRLKTLSKESLGKECGTQDLLLRKKMKTRLEEFERSCKLIFDVPQSPLGPNSELLMEECDREKSNLAFVESDNINLQSDIVSDSDPVEDSCQLGNSELLMEECDREKSNLAFVESDNINLQSDIVSELENFEKLDLRNLMYTTMARLIIYNKRRPGEVEMFRMDQYEAIPNGVDDIEFEILGELSFLERHLIENQKIVDLRNKRGRKPVPMLIPKDTWGPLEFLIDPYNRKQARIADDNPYIFANTGEGVHRGYDALKQIVSETTGLKSPDRVLCTNTRILFCTMIQLMFLPAREMRNVEKDATFKGDGQFLDNINKHRTQTGGKKWNSAELEAVRLHFDKEIHDGKRLTEDKFVQTIANVDILRQRTTVQLKSKIHYMIKPSHMRRRPKDL